MRRTPYDGSGTDHRLIVRAELLKLQKSGQFPDDHVRIKGTQSHYVDRDHRIREVASQLDVPTLLTPDSRHLLCFHFVCCVEKVSDLINRPVVSLLSIRVGGTSAEVVTKILELFVTTRREWFLRNDRYRTVSRHGRDKKCLPETMRPGFISTMRPDLTQPTHRLEEKDTIEDILFLRLKAGHLCPKDRVLNGSYY